ncbi:MAG TPA: hypothetical protein VGH85_12070, partial [Mycobacteriales bacterium]
RFATAGSLPAFTWLASVGDSLKLFGGANGFFAEPLAALAPPEPDPPPLPPPLPPLLLLFPLLHAASMAPPATAAEP